MHASTAYIHMGIEYEHLSIYLPKLKDQQPTRIDSTGKLNGWARDKQQVTMNDTTPLSTVQSTHIANVLINASCDVFGYSQRCLPFTNHFLHFTRKLAMISGEMKKFLLKMSLGLSESFLLWDFNLYTLYEYAVQSTGLHLINIMIG